MARDKTAQTQDEPVDPRVALQSALDLHRLTGQAVQVLRGYVEAAGALKGMEQRHAALAERSADLERELPVLKQRVEDARLAATQAEATARDAYAKEVAAVRADLATEQLRLADMRHTTDAEKRQLEEAYGARRAELTDEIGDLERKLAKLREEWAALVSKHGG